MMVLDDGNGPQLYCLGTQLIVGEGYLPWLRRWNGSEWVQTPSGMVGVQFGPWLSWDDGTGPALYGSKRIGAFYYPARWNGGAWDVIGTLETEGAFTMNVLEDGTGERLYIFGGFRRTGTTNQFVNIARWDGTDWEKIGDITGGKTARDIVSAVHNGQRWLYVAEYHNITGQGPVGRIMRWDGQTWSPLPGGGIANIGINAVHKLAVYDDGRGEALYIAGLFTMAGGLPVRNIVRFDGTSYEALGDGIGTWTEDMVVHDDGRGEALFVIGSFSYVSGGRAYGIAQWVGCPNCYANCDLSGVSPALNIDDFTCFINKFAAEDPYANCNLDAVLDISDFMCFIDRFSAGCP